MKTPDCGTIGEWIVTDLDEGLDAQKKTLLASHLSQCAACRRTRDELVELLSAFRADVPPDPGEEFWRRYRSSLDARLQEKTPVRSPFRRMNWRFVAVALTAMLVLAVVLVSHLENAPVKPQRLVAMSPELLQELEQVYGPVPDEVLGASREMTDHHAVVIVDGNIPLMGDTDIRWFEVEDDPSASFL